MTLDFSELMNSTLRLVREQRVTEATAEIQKALAGTPQQRSPEPPIKRARRPLRDVVEGLRLRKPPTIDLEALPEKRSALTPIPRGAEFLSCTFACAAGQRDYRLYVPSAKSSGKRPLLIMLHGCTQNADDFAAGTRMNSLAEAHGMLVAYPTQPKSANGSACWNWFSPKHQQRSAGEPAIIAGLTEAIISDHGGDPTRVYVAGLSAGGAMAVVMGATYPDLFAAIGVHSGLAYQSASDVMSAFAAMRGQSKVPAPSTSMRTIIFHGDADTTVHSSNGHQIAGTDELSDIEKETGIHEGGRKCNRTVIADASGVPQVEHWLIHGAGHAWSGGSPAGSYTDPQGPDASGEMVRFFLGVKR